MVEFEETEVEGMVLFSVEAKYGGTPGDRLERASHGYSIQSDLFGHSHAPT